MSTTAPQRPGFVLLWIGLFTVVMAAGVQLVFPAEPDTTSAEQLEPSLEPVLGPNPSYPSFLPDSPIMRPAAWQGEKATDQAFAGPRPDELLGRVETKDGVPARDVTVCLKVGPGCPSLPEEAALEATTTPDGMFRLGPLVWTGNVRLVALDARLRPLGTLALDLSALSPADLPLQLTIDHPAATLLPSELPTATMEASSRREKPRHTFLPLDSESLDEEPSILLATFEPEEDEPDWATPGDPRPRRIEVRLRRHPHNRKWWLIQLTAWFDEDVEDARLDTIVESLPPGIREHLKDLRDDLGRWQSRASASGGDPLTKARILQHLLRSVGKQKAIQYLARLTGKEVAKVRRFLKERTGD